MGRVNPLTDLSRSYLICLSQRGGRGDQGERERENYEPAWTGGEGEGKQRRGRRGQSGAGRVPGRP